MSNTTFPKTYHVLKSGFGVNLGERNSRVLYRGEQFTVTEEEYEETIDLKGNSWLDLTAEMQEERWGYVRFAEGPVPDGIEIGSDDSTVQFRRREYAVQQAHKLADPAERRKAFAEINRLYGPAESTQRSTSFGEY